MTLNGLAAAKFFVSGVVGIGTGKIVGKIIKNNITPETLIDKVTVSAAAWVVGAIATERTKTYTNDMIDDTVKTASKIISMIKLREKLIRINKGETTFETEGLDRKDFRRNAFGKWEKIETDDLQEKVNEKLDEI